MSNEQSIEQIKADAVSEFVNSIMGALESGFIDENTITLAELYRVMQNHCKDKFGVEVPHISELWGEDTALWGGSARSTER